jgi:hypothetical protein
VSTANQNACSRALTPQARRRLCALAPSAKDAIPMGGVERAERIFNATPSDWSEEKRLEHTKGVLRMIYQPAAVVSL